MAMERTDTAVAAAQQPMKFSRYRSVRKAAAKTPPDIPAHPPPSLAQPPATTAATRRPSTSPAQNPMATNGSAATIQRSMSRYRRQRAPPSRSSSDATTRPPVPLPTDQLLAYKSQAPAALPQQMRDQPQSGERKFENPTPVNPFIGDEEEDDEERELHRQNAMERLTGGDPMAKKTPPVSRRATTRERTVKHRDDRPRHADADPNESRHRHEHRRRSLKDLTQGSRSKKHTDTDVVAAEKLPDTVPAPLPGVDAPVSAVNAGERRVTVQYKKTSMDLPVTPTTSAQDLLHLASDCLSGEIDGTKFILMECFSELGLERPLRRYEAVRDVMNSWAHDRENSLVIVPPASLDALALLDAQRVPTQPPTDVTLHLYYSQRPRKWDKRYITLRSDGQITVSKKEHAQDQANVCHLSDFDVYSPTASVLSHTVKPPKKICQAIKSQQKSSMFLTTENFVHFFATNDKAIADRWYKAVQVWRSWYLVNKLGAGQPDDSSSSGSADDVTNQPSRPLLNLSDNFKETSPPGLDRSRSSRSKDLFSRKKSVREHGPPPSSFPKSFADEPDMPEPLPSGDAAFAASGLLGRTYTLRQRAMKEREERDKHATEEPFVAQGLVGTMATRRSRPNSRSNTMTATQAPDIPGLMSRSQSQKIKPLVDLTPVYQEPPQHIRKGKGVAVEPGQRLIDAATGPEVPGGIVIPPSTTWRRPPPDVPATSTPSEVRTRMRSNTARSTSHHHHHHRPPAHTAPSSPSSPIDGAPREEPFLPNSLLARSAQLATAQGSVPTGHGVATGDRNASKPMLDMSPENPFAEGSLLRGL